MKLKVILSIQPVNSETPRIAHEGVIDSSMGILNIGGALSQLLSQVWQEFRTREADFKKAGG